jgi:type IX secretion system PorP/SprF family membrane protein
MRQAVAIAFSIMLASCLTGQDLHFSHFYHTPLRTNPAQTGFFDGDLRLGGNYRNQWQSITVPYRTFSAWGDYVFHLSDRFSVSPGLVAWRDQAGDGELTTQSAFLSGAVQFHATQRTTIALGVSGGMVQKQLDFNRLVYDAQWTGLVFDRNLPSNELPGMQNLNYYDVQGGLLLIHRANQDLTMYGGFSMAHIITPQESFYTFTNQLGMRPVVHGGAIWQLNPEWSVEPSFIYQSQRGASEFIGGFNVGYVLREDTYVQALGGFWWRGTQEAIPSIGLQYNRVRGMLSYDFTLSTLQTAANSRGGMELSLVYIMRKKVPPLRRVIPCFRF